MQTQMLTNPANRVVDLAVFVSPQIEDVYLTIRLPESGKNGIDAILHVQIRFALMAVAEHMKMFGVGGKLLVKIKHMPVRVALTKNRYESKDVSLHSEAFAIGLNQTFRRPLGSSVEGSLNRERTGLGCRKNIGLAVDRTRRGKYDPFAALLAHGLKYVPSCDRVLFQIFSWMLDAEAYVRIRGEVDHEFRTLHRPSQTVPVEQVCLLEHELRMAHGTFQEPPLSRRHVVEPNHAVSCR